LYPAHRSTLDATAGIADTAKRKELCEPILADFYAWIDAEHAKLDDKDPIKKAMN